MGAAIYVDIVTFMRLYPVQLGFSHGSSLSACLFRVNLLGTEMGTNGGFRLSGQVVSNWKIIRYAGVTQW